VQSRRPAESSRKPIQTTDGILIPGYAAVMRETDKRVFCVATSEYEPIQNQQVVEFVRDWCDAGELQIDTIGSLRRGAIIWLLARLGESFQIGQDRTDGYLLIHSSHDRTLSFSGQTTSVRVVCMNTLRAATSGKGKRLFSLKHTMRAQEMIDHARKTVEVARQQFRQLGEIAQQLAEHRLSADDLLEFVGSLSGCITRPDRLLEANTLPLTFEDFTRQGQNILHGVQNAPGADLPGSKGTLWGAVNGVTYYVDHVAGRGREAALESAWFGPRADLKAEALEKAYAIVRK
jgi:phage/plasmid-like protein (TIGR03299 family)